MYSSHIERVAGGLVTQNDPAILENGQSPNLQNVEFRSNTCRKRNGGRKINRLMIRAGGLRFDGTSGWALIPEVADGPNQRYRDLTITQTFTVSIACSLTALSGSTTPQVIAAKGDLSQAAGARLQWAIVQVRDAGTVERFRVLFDNGAATLQMTSTITAATATRYRLTFTFQGSNNGNAVLFRIHNIDAGTSSDVTSLDAAGVIPANVQAVTAPIILGALGNNSAGFVDFTLGGVRAEIPLNGTIDDFRLFANAASSADINTYFDRELDASHSTLTGTGGLRAYFRLNDRNGLAVADSVNSLNTTYAANNGTLHPRRPTYVTGLVPDESGYALRFDGLETFGFVATDTTFSAQTGPSYDRHFAYNVDVRPVWCVEFSFNIRGTSNLNLELFRWMTDAVANNTILRVYTGGGGAITFDVSYQDAAAANDATTTTGTAFAPTVGTTYHVAVTRDLTAAPESTFTIYVDYLSSAGTPTRVSATFTTGGALLRAFGPDGANTGIFLASLPSTTNTPTSESQVDIDEVRIWDNAQTANAAVVARSGAEVLQYFDKPLPQKERDALTSGTSDAGNTGGGPPPNREQPKLIHYWTCDDNTRDYNDAYANVAVGTSSRSLSFMGAADFGGSQVIRAATVRYLGSISLRLLPGSHSPEWAPGILGGVVRGGLVDGVRTFKRSDGTEQLVLAAEGSFLTVGSDVALPATLTTQRASGLQGGAPVAFVSTRDRLYLTNGFSPPLAWDGTTVRRWGVQGPTFAPTYFRTATTATSGTGVVQYRYSYVSRTSGTESDPSPPGAFLNDGLGATQHALGLFHSPDTQVDAIRIYRTTHGSTTGTPKAGSTDFFFVDEITNDPASTAPTTYTDTVTDAQLGAALAGLAFPVSGPPPWCRYATYFNGRMFVAFETRNRKSRTTLFYSESLEPEKFGALNTLDFESGEGEPITGIAPLYARLLVFKRTSIYALSGFGPTSFQQDLIIPDVGTFSHFSIVPADGWLYFLSDRGPMRFNGVQIEWIGRSIVDTWTGFGKFDVGLAVGGHNKDLHQIWWALRSAQTASSNDRVLVYDYLTQTFTIHTGIYAQSMDSSIDSQGDSRLFTGDDYGFLWRQTNSATNNDGDLGFAGTTSGTASGGGTSGAFAFLTVAGAFADDEGGANTTSGWKGLRIQLVRGAVTAEARILRVPSTTQIIVDQTPTQLGFTPDSTTTYRIAAINASYDTRPMALVAPGDFARVEEVEVEAKYTTDNNANAAGVSTVTLSVSDLREFATAVEATLTQAQTVGNAAGAVTTASTSDRFNLKSRSKRYQVRIANDRPHEGFEVRGLTVRYTKQDRT